MKKTAKKAIRDETGGALVLTLVLLLVGGLIIAPLLGFMGTGTIAGGVHEKRMDELYAADAGVEDAIWGIRNDEAEFDEDGYSSYPDNDVDPPWMINDRSVGVEIWRTEIEGSTSCHKVFRYHIRSIATGTDGTATRIDAIVTSTELDYSDLSGSAITSGGDVQILPEGTMLGEIQGDISLPPGNVISPSMYEDEGYDGGLVKRETLDWPKEGDFITFYGADVSSTDTYFSPTLNVKDRPAIGRFRKTGSLDIYSNQGGSDLFLDINDTVYIDGDTTIGKTAQDFTLRLNGNTIFVASDSRKTNDDTAGGSYALEIQKGCTIEGPGAIVAIGDIWFGPTMQVGGTEPVLVFSVSGTAHLHPDGTFYGAIVGNAGVSLNPSNDIIYPEGGIHGINFPGLIEGKETYRIDSWTITTIVPD